AYSMEQHLQSEEERQLQQAIEESKKSHSEQVAKEIEQLEKQARELSKQEVELKKTLSKVTRKQKSITEQIKILKAKQQLPQTSSHAAAFIKALDPLIRPWGEADMTKIK